MKKLLFLLALGAATPSFCAIASAQGAAPTAVVAPAPFNWQLRLKTGQKWRTTSDTITRSTQQMAGMGDAAMSMKTVAQNHLLVEQSVLSSDEKGARIEMIYREISQSSQVMQGDKLVFSTDNPPPGMKGLAGISKAFVGSKISYLLSPGGQVSEVKGTEEIAKRLGEAMDGAAPGLMAAMKAQTASMFSPDTLKKSLGASYQALPTQVVTPGQTWKYTDVSPMMGTTFSTEGEGTFLGRENGLVTVKQTATFSTDGGAQFNVPLPATDAKKTAPVSQLDLHGTSSGQSWIDENTGLEMRSQSKQKLEGELVINGLEGRGGAMTIPMTTEVEASSQTELLPELTAPAA